MSQKSHQIIFGSQSKVSSAKTVVYAKPFSHDSNNILKNYGSSEEIEINDRDLALCQKQHASKTQADRLRDTRVDLGISQDELAKVACIQKKDITDCEAGKITISTQIWNKIDVAFRNIKKKQQKEVEDSKKAM